MNGTTRSAGQDESSPTVLFVCEHGSAKSVVAAAHFNRLASERGLPFRAISKGTDPDAAVHPAASAGLAADGLRPGAEPSLLAAEDLTAARHVVAFSALPPSYGAGDEVEVWSVPPVSEDYELARSSIVERLSRLLEELAEEPPTGRLPIRQAEARDAAALARLAESTFRAAFGDVNTRANMDAFCAAAFGAAIQAREIVDPAMETIVVESGGELVAYAQLRRGRTPACVTGRAPIEVQRFYVDSRWHGRGLAQELMAHLLARARAGGADTVWLGVWEHNPRAIAFYRRFGFADVGGQEFRLGDDVQLDLVMALALGEPPGQA